MRSPPAGSFVLGALPALAARHTEAKEPVKTGFRAPYAATLPKVGGQHVDAALDSSAGVDPN